jgi:hypothetical protein
MVSIFKYIFFFLFSSSQVLSYTLFYVQVHLHTAFIITSTIVVLVLSTHNYLHTPHDHGVK